MYKKLTCCKYCSLDFLNLNSSERANHSRWCDKNPKHDYYVAKADGKQFNNIEVISKRNIGIKKAWVDGKYDNMPTGNNLGYRHTEYSKDLIRKKALASTHRRLLRSIRPYTKLDGSVISLDSSWEEALAIRLDELSVEWTRPSPLPWIDSDGNKHNYFPDFYLTKFDLFLDPKNPYAIEKQQSKLQILSKQYNNIIIIKSLDECKSFNPNEITTPLYKE